MLVDAYRAVAPVVVGSALTMAAALGGGQFDASMQSVVEKLRRVGDLDAVLSELTRAVEQLDRAMTGGTGGLREIGSGADDMRAGMAGLQS